MTNTNVSRNKARSVPLRAPRMIGSSNVSGFGHRNFLTMLSTSSLPGAIANPWMNSALASSLRRLPLHPQPLQSRGFGVSFKLRKSLDASTTVALLRIKIRAPSETQIWH
ncbi:hypothetical protein Tcan_13093 [Toxocara canis]|uniref:Uncharacterized protein n=1 Tax=Toxocara canis TaxID=6265 RepID=A0A0B2UTA9_TOXCA|nr:hypothetical protein Tcan_13093 [Toxocara canis]